MGGYNKGDNLKDLAGLGIIAVFFIIG